MAKNNDIEKSWSLQDLLKKGKEGFKPDDEFYADAMEGLEEMDHKAFTGSVESINSKLDERASIKEAKTINLPIGKWAIAASFILLMGFGLTFITKSFLQSENKAVSEKVQHEESSATSSDNEVLFNDADEVNSKNAVKPIEDSVSVRPGQEAVLIEEIEQTTIANEAETDLSIEGSSQTSPITIKDAVDEKVENEVEVIEESPPLPKAIADNTNNFLNEDYSRKLLINQSNEFTQLAISSGQISDQYALLDNDDGRMISGFVFDENTNRPLRGASIKNNNYTAYTDQNGAFSIEAGPAEDEISITSAGYDSYFIDVSTVQNKLNIPLSRTSTDAVAIAMDDAEEDVRGVPSSMEPAAAQTEALSSRDSKAKISKSERKDTDAFKEGRSKYNQGLYEEASEYLDNAVDDNPANVEALYLYAMSQYNIGKLTRAIKTYDKVIQISSPSSNFSVQSKWFKANALIQKKSFNEAKELLRELVFTNSVFKDKASQKLNELN